MNHAIEKRIELLNQAEKELRTHKEMIADALANDGELATLDEKAKEAKRRYNSQKEAVLNEPDLRKLAEKAKDVQQEIRDNKALLSDELVAYFMEGKTFEYVDGDGKKRRFKVNAKFTGSKEEE